MPTYLGLLAALNAIQAWKRLPPGKYGPGFISRRDWVSTLANPGRRVPIALIRQAACLACSHPLPLSRSARGDHLIPLSQGGTEGPENYLPLCPKCNSRKGQQDLLEWWQKTGRDLTTLSSDVLVAYYRLKYRWCQGRGLLHQEAPDYLALAVESFRPSLPPAVWQAIVAVRRRP